MRLLEIGELPPLLACPRCHFPLAQSEGLFSCTNPSCPLSKRPFRSIDNRPVLVDFENSILDENRFLSTNGASPVEGRDASLAKRVTKRVLFPPSPVTKANVARFIRLLKKAKDNPTVLVVGGGVVGSSIDELYEDQAIRLIGFDIYCSTLIQFVADGHQIPLRGGSVDGVLVQAVLEHVLDPWRVVAEIHRVLKDDGLVYAETPFMQQVHEGPYDFTRFTESGHRYLFRKFELIDSGVVLGTGYQVSWTVDHAGRSLFRSVKAGKALKALLFWVRLLDRVTPEPFAVDNASGVLFLGKKSDKEVSPREMVAHYKGAQR